MSQSERYNEGKRKEEREEIKEAKRQKKKEKIRTVGWNT
jgi:hypothetical protein